MMAVWRPMLSDADLDGSARKSLSHPVGGGGVAVVWAHILFMVANKCYLEDDLECACENERARVLRPWSGVKVGVKVHSQRLKSTSKSAVKKSDKIWFGR